MPQAGSKAYLEWATSWIIRKQRLWREERRLEANSLWSPDFTNQQAQICRQ